MIQSRAVIVVKNPEALRAAAASARISTQQGTALEIFEKSAGDERDLNLLNKVLASGHRSVIEHQTFTVAFNDVSVLAEQFAIECRLASFTVKSRRYVDFGAAGWVRPEGLNAVQAAQYDGAMAARFEDYRYLMELGVPKEDARFVLPYCLRSNFFMTLNARELIALVCAMLYGRGRGFAELEALGKQLKEQFDAIYPGVIDREAVRYPRTTPMPLPREIRNGAAREIGLSMENLSYFALSGHQTDLMLSMDLRELVHFMKLRTCNRAQWEIRGVAWKMLELLKEREPDIFRYIGPSCVYGPCPEGRMSCGKPYRMEG